MTTLAWTQKFQEKINALNKPDRWTLEFDYTIEAQQTAPGWKEYIRSPFSLFTCSTCSHRWASSKSKVVFHMRLDTAAHEGRVKARPYKQSCGKCPNAVFEEPSFDGATLENMIEKLVEKIQEKCYGEDRARNSTNYYKKVLKGDHLREHCEACQKGICDLS